MKKMKKGFTFSGVSVLARIYNEVEFLKMGSADHCGSVTTVQCTGFREGMTKNKKVKHIHCTVGYV